MILQRLASLWPPQRRRAVPWWGAAVLAVLFVHTLALVIAADPVRTGFLQPVYQFFDADFLRGAKPDSPERKLYEARCGLWVQLLAFPLQLPAIIGLLHITSGALPYQLGLTTHRLWRNVLLGLLGWLAVTPVVLCLHGLVKTGYQHWIEAPPQHPVEMLARSRPPGVEAIALIVLVVVLAPVMEELLFRGILQPWLCRSRKGGYWVFLWVTAYHCFSHWESLTRAVGERSPRLLFVQMQPLFFLLIMLAGYAWMERREWRIAAALHVGAAAFGVIHPWPTPIPLYLLALALGYLAYRTQSLAASMVLHGLFNSFACVMLFLGPP